jgi:hypothetical protein
VVIHPAKAVKAAWTREHPKVVREHPLWCRGPSQGSHPVLHPRSSSRQHSSIRHQSRALVMLPPCGTQLRHTLAASAMCHDPTDSTLHFLKVEHKYAIKWSLSFFLISPLLHTSKVLYRMLLLVASSTGTTNAFPISFTDHRH